MMKKQIIDTNLIENKKLTLNIILICLSQIEKLINRYAYLSKKFKNAGEAFSSSNKYELNKYIEYRQLLSKAIYPKYKIDDIKLLIKSDYATAKCSAKTIDDIVTLVKSGDYTLLSQT